MKLPRLPYADKIRQSVQVKFGGVDRGAGAEDGTVRDMRNLWSGDAPRLSVRPGRRLLRTLETPNGLFVCGERVFWVDGTTLYCDGAAVPWASGLPVGGSYPSGTGGEAVMTNTEKVFCALGERVLIWPDKVMARPAPSAGSAGSSLGEGATPSVSLAADSSLGEGAAYVLEPLEMSVTLNATFTDGTYAGETAEANTIQAAVSTFRWSDYFSVGDGVTISGASDAANNATLVVREIDGSALRFYENSFTVNSTAATITVAREVPDLDFLCVNENRVWGCKGDTVRCCMLGDPRNWNVFDGVSTDAWSWDTGTAGEFTAAVSFLGYPCFFKERQIFKVYGNRPKNYETMSAADLGVAAGSGKSLAVANETLFYLSRTGIMAYSGGIPVPVGTELGGRFRNAVGGSDGLRYYVSMADEAGQGRLYVYDALRAMWHIEDETEALFLASQSAGSVLCLETGGEMWTTDSAAGGTAEEPVSWYAEFADYTMDSPNKKGVSKLLVRLEPASGSTAGVSIQYDSDGVWRSVASLTAQQKRSWVLPVIPRRCDHFRVRLSGIGPCIVHSLTVESYTGSALQRH